MSVSHIQKREIQAPIVKCLLEGFIKHFGEDEVNKVLNKLIEEDAKKSGEEMAKLFGGNSMKHLAEVIRKIWAEDNAMEMEFIEENDERLSFNVVKCLYAKTYESNNMKKLGVCLSCNRDKPFTKGFNSEFELIRTQTIMEGADHCDFRFVKKSDT